MELRADTSSGENPQTYTLSEIVRLIDGPVAPFGGADQLRELIDRDLAHRALYRVFLDVRDAAARVLEHTTLADLIVEPPPLGKAQRHAKQRKQKKEPGQRPSHGGRRPFE